MPKSKNRKDHKKKVANRNFKIKQEQEKIQKSQRDFLMKLIEQEKQKGMFDNTPSIPSFPNLSEGPTFGPTI